MQQSCHVDLGGFKTVAFDWGQIHMRGGCLGKAAPMTSKTIPLKAPKRHRGDGDSRAAHSQTFIKLSMTESWLILATTGQRNFRNTAFGRTSLLDLLRDKVLLAANGELDGFSSDDSAVAEDEDQGYDPMDMVNAPVEEPAGKRAKTKNSCQGKRRTYYYKNFAKSRVVYTNMPEKTPEEDPTGKEQRRIALYIQDRLTIWLDIHDVPWAVRFLYVQNMLKGVPLLQGDSSGPGGETESYTPLRGDGE